MNNTYNANDNIDFGLEDNNFSFDMYENIPIGEHIATITDIAIERNRPTKYGVKDSITVVFHLQERTLLLPSLLQIDILRGRISFP